MLRFLIKYKQVFLYAASLAAILFLLQVLEYRFILLSHSFEIYITCIAILFTSLGIWLALKLVKPKTELQTIVVEKNVYVKELTEEEK